MAMFLNKFRTITLNEHFVRLQSIRRKGHDLTEDACSLYMINIAEQE